MTEGEEQKPRGLKDILIRPENPGFDAAEQKARETVDRAQLNEAIRVIDQLIEEVRSMPIASRYKLDKRPSESLLAANAPSLNPILKDLNEPEFKRQTLLNNLERIKTDTVRAISQLGHVVLDIEATKTEG